MEQGNKIMTTVFDFIVHLLTAVNYDRFIQAEMDLSELKSVLVSPQNLVVRC